jgi:hypothetical protein
MKWTLCLVTVAAAGCQEAKQQQQISDPQGTTVISLPKAQVNDAYKGDISALCDCVKLSGAEAKPKDERWPVIAMWLGPNIKTNEGHEFLIAIQPLKGEAKALALETEAKRVGLAACALAAEWRADGT